MDKGKALQAFQKRYGISKEETMVFGDFYNDSQMLLQAKYSFVMENANEDMKPFGNFIAPSNDDDGVMRMIKNMCSMPAGKLKQPASNFPLISGAVLVPVCALPFLPYCPASTAYSRSMKLEKRELQFDGYRLSLSYLFVVPVIGLLIYLGFAFFQCHLRENTAGILLIISSFTF